ncbi:MAG: tRNA (N(6)-L-threonylcarbamoyladenosine(37)-C(2))-methylthiotransferase MtaB [Candidatus Delongbacteria bacterium]|jgi:threonylcarbamoyladenosine tRNA methylthiotransferase MtaB|nr:tRNA (N(6)-L-threonylcarbamoyladenosine(37)-C(2))-methylthiotransferase MtaB [Candidatus Delongbacteria bacterium]
MNKRFAYYSLGCKLNFAEASSLGTAFTDQAYQRVQFKEKADVYLINTCTVTENANKKSRNAIYRAIRNNPDAVIIVTGCYAQMEPEKLASIRGVDYVIGNHDKSCIINPTENLHKQEQPVIMHSTNRKNMNIMPAWSSGERTRSFLKIQDGCDNFCSYCTIPYARGSSRNLPVSQLITQAKTIASNGFKEIILTGVNIADFGKSTNENFLSLLKALSKLDGIKRIRVSSTEPDLLDNDIVDFVLEHPVFMPHFHIPLQSGSNEMLKRMRRNYSPDLFSDRINYIKQKNKDAYIGVDIIVGVPGETDALFQQSLDFASSLDVAFFHVFTFSQRPGTKAFSQTEQVPIHIRRERSQALHELSRKKEMAFYRSQAGNTRPVLFESKIRDNMIHGFTDNYLHVAVPVSHELINQIQPVYLDKLKNNCIFISKL